VAVLVLFAAVVAPALQIGFLLLIVLGVQRGGGSGSCSVTIRRRASGA
jgi:hypothetical protein